MKRQLEYRVCSKDKNIRVEQFLREKGFSRHILAHLKRTQDGICLNGEWCFVNQTLTTGDLLTVNLIEDASSPHIVPVPLPIAIIYEDDDIMVINKAADMPVHPSMGNYENTLANGLAHYFKQQGIPFVFRCINRLDRDTTGLLIVAKHMYSAARLSEMVSKRSHPEAGEATISGEYLAIATGHVPDCGTIDAPIGRRDTSLIERCVDFNHGETAITHFQTLKHTKEYSLVSLRLETGRTHQIRVHMKHLGFPLLGDSLYNPGKTSAKIRRQALHSHRLQFPHPISGEEMSFVAPLPEDMAWIVAVRT